MPCFQFITPNINTRCSPCSASLDCLYTDWADGGPWAIVSEVSLMTRAKWDVCLIKGRIRPSKPHLLPFGKWQCLWCLCLVGGRMELVVSRSLQPKIPVAVNEEPRVVHMLAYDASLVIYKPFRMLSDTDIRCIGKISIKACTLVFKICLIFKSNVLSTEIYKVQKRTRKIIHDLATQKPILLSPCCMFPLFFMYF